MTVHALMKKGEATMHVPPDKVKQYEADGWKVIERPSEPTPQPVVEDIKPQAEAITAEQAAKTIGKKSAKKA